MTDAHKREQGQDARFDSRLSWVWWPLLEYERNEASVNVGGVSVGAECIDSSTGFAFDYDDEHMKQDRSSQSTISLVSSSALLRLFVELKDSQGNHNLDPSPKTLKQFRALKRDISPEYETAKDNLLSKHRVFRHWRRREYECKSSIKEGT